MLKTYDTSQSFGSWGLHDTCCVVARNEERRCRRDTREYDKGGFGGPQNLGRRGECGSAIVQGNEREAFLRMDRVQNRNRPRHAVKLQVKTLSGLQVNGLVDTCRVIRLDRVLITNLDRL